jgi:hypothetical protein
MILSTYFPALFSLSIISFVWATDGMLTKYNCCSLLDGMEKLLVVSAGDHHPFLTEQGESPESTLYTLTVRIPSNSDWGRPTRSPCKRGVCCVWCLSWNIFFRNRILEDHLEFVKLLEIHFRLRILLSLAILYAVLLQTTKQHFIDLLPFVCSPGERSV